MRQAISELCAKLGTDPLLVQGAGGNASWKDQGTLWVKASGTWLADALRKDIFVPVDLTALRAELDRHNFDAPPVLAAPSSLRPSIETVLHGLLPHKVVLHVHAVDALSHLVREDFAAGFAPLAAQGIKWAAIPYAKPGAPLAGAVAQALADEPDASVFLLQNHGIVLGGQDAAAVEALLATVSESLHASPRPIPADRSASADPFSIGGVTCTPVQDPLLHALAIDPYLFGLVRQAWALYPDHVVFLGARASCFDAIDEASLCAPPTAQLPDFIFVRGHGVYTPTQPSNAKLAQLQCYLDVVRRLPEGTAIRRLTDKEIADLMNWDAEQYRQHLAR